MEKKTAFTSDFDHRALYHTARDAREAEFDHMMLRISANIPMGDEKAARHFIEALAVQLRIGIYTAGVECFLDAADYLRKHRDVLTGATIDPQEDSR